MRWRRLKRRLFWTSVVLALLVIYVALSVVRLGIATRALLTRKARPAGLSR